MHIGSHNSNLEENSAVNCNKASPSFSALSGTKKERKILEGIDT